MSDARKFTEQEKRIAALELENARLREALAEYMGRAEGLEAERDHYRIGYARLRDCLRDLWDDGWLTDIHLYECPEDDTCECPWPARINAALATARNAVARRCTSTATSAWRAGSTRRASTQGDESE